MKLDMLSYLKSVKVPKRNIRISTRSPSASAVDIFPKNRSTIVAASFFESYEKFCAFCAVKFNRPTKLVLG